MLLFRGFKDFQFEFHAWHSKLSPHIQLQVVLKSQIANIAGLANSMRWICENDRTAKLFQKLESNIFEISLLSKTFPLINLEKYLNMF